MKVVKRNGKCYRVPSILAPFQEEMYLHLIDWKWAHITKDPGHYTRRGERMDYDAILPESVRGDFPVIYRRVLEAFKQHQESEEFSFKLHQHFNHMASSQAANVNLFLPILLSPHANDVLRQVKRDFGELAVDKLDHGFQFEYWGPKCDNRGLLRDHTKLFGTDADIAIAYYDNTGKRDPRLWLIEHKLTEKEFTECHGITSKGRKSGIHDCKKSFTELLQNMDYCYYRQARKFRYWEITADNQGFFGNHRQYSECPFKGGMNQLWRNQLLGLAVESDADSPYKRVYFSVVRHPENRLLDNTINEYRALVGDNERFSGLTSLDVVKAAAAVSNPELDRWVAWYRDLYRLRR